MGETLGSTHFDSLQNLKYLEQVTFQIHLKLSWRTYIVLKQEQV